MCRASHAASYCRCHFLFRTRPSKSPGAASSCPMVLCFASIGHYLSTNSPMAISAMKKGRCTPGALPSDGFQVEGGHCKALLPVGLQINKFPFCLLANLHSTVPVLTTKYSPRLPSLPYPQCTHHVLKKKLWVLMKLSIMRQKDEDAKKFVLPCMVAVRGSPAPGSLQ